MKIAELRITQTSAECVSYRLYETPQDSITAPARLVWSNRVYDQPAGHAGARMRARAWALKHGYRVVEGKEGQRKRA